MKNGVCPICESTEVHLVSNTATEVAIGINWLNTAFIDYHVCTSCGHVELFIQDKAMLPKIAEKFPKVK